MADQDGPDQVPEPPEQPAPEPHDPYESGDRASEPTGAGSDEPRQPRDPYENALHDELPWGFDQA